MESRKEKAVELFMEGYNCSQAVFAAYADLFGIDFDMALKLSASFGAGMGRMREVCGAVSGMFLVAGLMTGTTDGKDVAGKQANYDMVQKLAAEYKKKYGSIICREILGLAKRPGGFTDTKPDARTAEYYKKRPCVVQIAGACEILERELFADRSGS